MTNHDLETQLRQAYQGADVEVRSSSMSEAILLARKEAYSRQQRLSFPQFLSMQIRFIGWKVWAVQAACLLTVCGLLSHLLGQGYWKDPQSVAGLLVCLSLLTFMAAPPFLYRSVRYRMQEVEAAARFSSVQLLMARLIIIGIGDRGREPGQAESFRQSPLTERRRWTNSREHLPRLQNIPTPATPCVPTP